MEILSYLFNNILVLLKPCTYIITHNTFQDLLTYFEVSAVLP